MIHRSVDGSRIPGLGFGTWRLWGDECERMVATALDLGYRHIDSAQRYENETEVGRGLKQSGVARSEVFLTTKLDIGHGTPEAVRRTTRESLDRLGTDYVDLLMIHWPEPDLAVEVTLGAMAEMQEAGLTRHLGVCNFPPSLLDRAIRTTRIVTNQVEYHPYLSQSGLLDRCRAEGMVLTAFAPLARGKVLEDPTLVRIGEGRGKTAAQVALRWLVQQEAVAAIPKTANAERAQANLDIFDFELSADEVAEIDALAMDGRLLDPPHAPDWEG